MSYVDTSVIVAALDRLDPRRASALEALEKKGGKKVSELVVTELASVLSRRKEMLRGLATRIGVRGEIIVPATLLYILRRFGLECKRINGRKRVLFLGDLYSPFATAIELSSRLKVKTLDLLHLAYIKTLIEGGEEIREIVTVDEDFEREKRAIKDALNIEVIVLESPRS